MEVEVLSRIQFGLTIAFHYLFPPLSIGIGLALVCMEGMYLKTKNRIYEEMTKFWVKIFALTFALGVATGLVMSFAFGNNWANYSRFVGDVFGSALAAEGIFAFFLEAGFLAVLLFGWDKVSPKIHFLSTILVSIGSHFSAVWIVIANSWMQTPAGYKIVGEGSKAHATITDFWAMVFNPSSMERLAHVIVGCWLAGSFFVISVGAYYLLKKRFTPYAIPMLKIGFSIAIVATLLQLVLGDISARGVAKNQPAKLAAFEGLYKTQEGAPLSVFGIVNNKEEKVDYSVAIPKLLSLFIYRDADHVVTGLDAYPKNERPNVAVVFQTYHIMIGMWCLMFFGCIIGCIAWKKKWIVGKWPLRFLVISVLFPQIANQAGWFSAEMGRQPWIVHGLMRTSEGLSKSVSASQVLSSLIMFSALYTLLFILFIYLLNNKIQHGPADIEDEVPVYQKNPLKLT